MPYKCALCEKSFITQLDFKIHQHGIHPFSEKKGSIEDILKMITILHLLLENIMAMLHKCGLGLNKKKKQVDCCKYLNEKHGRLEYTYDEWRDTMTGTKGDFNYFLSDDLASCIIHMIKRHTLDHHTMPIRCFDVKNNQFYIYGKDHKWCKMERDDHLKLFRLCSAKIYPFYNEYINENNNCTGMSDIYTKTSLKWSSNTDDKMKRRVKKQLFNHLKENVSALVEIELC